MADFDQRGIRRFFELSLLGMLASGYCALLLARLSGEDMPDAPSLALAGVALLARVCLVAGLFELRFPPRLVTWLAGAYLAFYPLDIYFVSGNFQQATVHLVFFVASVKMLTGTTSRDYFLLKVVAFLELLAASILSAGVSFFICLVAFLLASVATFTSHEILKAGEGRQLVARRAGSVGRRLGVLTVSALGAILLLTLALFFVLPRTAQAALEHFLPASRRVSGMASEVTLGIAGEIRRNTAPMMHVRFEGERRPAGLKWRGQALGEFNGLKWYNSRRDGERLHPTGGMLTVASDDDRRRETNLLTYQVVLHQTGSDSLFIAGRPVFLQIPWNTVVAPPQGGYRIPFAEIEDFRYVVYASELDWGGTRNATLSNADRDFYLRLPPVDKRIGALAEQLTAGAKTDEERARAIERYLRTAFSYSLRALDHEVEDPLAAFLFDTRRGHCEYFASAMAVLLRERWIPARVATGFQSGSFNPLSGWNVIRASDAHSWVEAWIPGRGWTTFDPTPPDPNQGASATSKLALWVDAAEMFWQEWVLGYDLDRQLTLAFRVDESRRRLNLSWARELWLRLQGIGKSAAAVPPKNYGYAVLGLAFLAGLVALLPVLKRLRTGWQCRRRLKSGQAAPHDAALVYRRMTEVMRRRGVEKPAWWTPREFVGALAERAEAPLVREFTESYYLVRFGGRPDHSARLASLIEQLERLPR